MTLTLLILSLMTTQISVEKSDDLYHAPRMVIDTTYHKTPCLLPRDKKVCQIFKGATVNPAFYENTLRAFDVLISYPEFMQGRLADLETRHKKELQTEFNRGLLQNVEPLEKSEDNSNVAYAGGMGILLGVLIAVITYPLF